jgi:hypothetical protein
LVSLLLKKGPLKLCGILQYRENTMARIHIKKVIKPGQHSIEVESKRLKVKGLRQKVKAQSLGL